MPLIRYSIAKTPLGEVFVAATDLGLCSLILENVDEEIIEKLGKRLKLSIRRDDDSFIDFLSNLEEYFRGSPTSFDFDLDLRGSTPFQKSVWETMRQIPFGETRSYKWLANEIHRPDALRAVGQAVGANPIPIVIPCHRIIHENGSLGGFQAGLEWKIRLLTLERGQYSFF